MSRTTSIFYVLDRPNASVVVVPALAGVDEASRVALYDHEAGEYTHVHEVAAGGVWRVPLRDVVPLSRYSMKLQTRRDGRWLDAAPPSRLSSLGSVSVLRLTTREWGVHTRAVVALRDTNARRELMRAAVEPDEVVEHLVDNSDGVSRVQLDVFAATEGDEAGTRLLPPIRLVPLDKVGEPGPPQTSASSGLRYVRHRDVTLAPLTLSPNPSGGLGTFGFVGAWSGATPVVEAMEFVLGRQRYLHYPTIPAAEDRGGTVIYLGSPHGSWGHFLTQGLARVWYALENPTVPVVWDAPRLAGYHETVLDVLGLTNPQIFLTAPMRFDEVIFPYPGISLGDYVSPEFARAIGRVPREPVVPGKKLLLSRASLGTARGGLHGGADTDLDSVARSHGFVPFHPEQHSVERQLAEMSSAEAVLGIEGSAFHTLLLLEGRPTTRFWALTRHRKGSGVFEHLKAAKGLRYETLNFLRSPAAGARGPIDLDLEALDRALALTDGLTRDLHLIEERRERPVTTQTSYETHIRNCLVRLGTIERDAAAAVLHLRAGDVGSVRALLTSYL